MALVRFDPAGTDGSDVIVSGTVLNNVIKSGSGTVKYASAGGFDRGNNVGVEIASPVSTDTANIIITNTSAAAGAGQVYGYFKSWPTVGQTEFFGLRSSGGNALRLGVGTSGQIFVQNNPGVNIAALTTLSLLTVYRFDIQCKPDAAGTAGYGAVQIYDDDDNLVDQMAPISNGNFGTATNINLVRVGKVGGSQGPITAYFTQLALDTGSTVPTIPSVDKIVVPSPTSGNYDLVWTGAGTGWK